MTELLHVKVAVGNGRGNVAESLDEKISHQLSILKTNEVHGESIMSLLTNKVTRFACDNKVYLKYLHHDKGSTIVIVVNVV